MDHKKEIKNNKDVEMMEDFGAETMEEVFANEDMTEEVKPLSLSRASSSANNAITDKDQLLENPYSFFKTNQVNVQLNSGHIQYEVTDFVLPGRDGFDLSITRRYDSDRANLKDMELQITGWQEGYQKHYKIRTGSKDSDFDNKMYGLGYGWSFNLPSIETISYKVVSPGGWDYYYGVDYIVHLADGRSVNDKEHNLDDYSWENKSGSIVYPYDSSKEIHYHTIIKHKNGNKDYFKRENRTLYSWYSSHNVYDYRLVAREDRFGNMIFFELKDYGGMKVVDTWGRTIELKDKNGRLTWTLPEADTGNNYEISYKIEYEGGLSKPQKLMAAKNMTGLDTTYQYYETKDKTGKMRCSAPGSEETTTIERVEAGRPYMLLSDIEYPNGAKTQLEYQNELYIYNESGGHVSHFPLSAKTDFVGTKSYHKAEYSYTRSGNKEYIESSTVKKRNDIKEVYTFYDNGLMSVKEVKQKSADSSNDEDVSISKNSYTYNDDKLLTLMEEQIFKIDDTSKTLKKTATYTWDNKANLTKEVQEYTGESSYKQEITTTYDADTNLITEIESKKGIDVIKKAYMLDTTKEKRVIKSQEILENDVLKEKTEYSYQDINNPYCITNERRYALMTNGTTVQPGSYAETIYQYYSNRCTHSYKSKEQTGIKDADNKVCASIKETIDYDNWGRVISKTNARNQKSLYCYDEMGRLTKETLPSVNGQIINNETKYNDKKGYITKTDENQKKKRIQYNPFGQVEKVFLATADDPETTDILLCQYQYNTWGELIEVTTYDGNGTAAANIRKTEQYTYDSFSRVLTKEVPQVGYVETWEYDHVVYDQEDKKTYACEQKTVTGDSNAATIVTKTYKDLKGQIRKEFVAGKRIVTCEYDNVGNNIRKLDAGNRVERWEYDYAGRVVKSIQTVAGKTQNIRVEYDALGNKSACWDEAGKKTEFHYDAAGRLVKTDAPFDGRTQSDIYYYDASGNTVREKKARDDGWQEVSYVYDALNRVTDAYQYLTSTTWIRTSYQYDKMNNVVQMRTGGTPSGEGRQVTNYTYDRFGNVVTMTDACGYKETYQYDKAGQLQEKTDRNGNRIVYQHDALERLIKETAQNKTPDGLVKNEREYIYSKNGAKVKETSREIADGSAAVSLETRYYYDDYGWMIRQIDPENAEKIYTYDIYGNRQSFQLKRSGQTAADINQHYRCDELNRLIQVRKDSASGAVLAEYEYDERGNRKVLRYPQMNMETSYQYNEGRRITSLVTKRQGTVISNWKYHYDRVGNLLAKTDSSGSVPVAITYRYDKLGRLTEEDYPGWKRTFYTYDIYSNRSRMMVEGKTKDELVSVTTYEYDLNNRLEKEIRKQGKTTETYLYYYDKNGNETFRLWERTRPTPDYPGTVKLSGNWKAEIPTVYEWRYYNGFNQLIKINQDEKEIQYKYRGDGLRHCSNVRELTNSQSKTNVLFWDGTDIVAEQVDGGTIKTYHRGVNLIASETKGMIYYYLHNEHGDVTQLWKGSGTRRCVYEYDAFGVERSPIEEDDNPFRYCGEYFDVETKTVYLRARDYRAGTGRFLAEDPIRDGLNWYNYCSNSPVLKSDPSGLYEVYDPHTRAYVNISDPIEASLYSTNPYEKLRILVESQGWTVYEGMTLEEVYYLNMSPASDGVGNGMHNASNKVDFDYWYPLPEHKEQYKNGVKYAPFAAATLAFAARMGDITNTQTIPYPDEMNISKTQTGSKWGKHKYDYPDMKSYQDYSNRAQAVFNNADRIIPDYSNKEFYYIQGNDLLRISETGDFISLYPGATSQRVLDAINALSKY